MSPSNLDRGKTPLGEIPNPPTRLIMKCIIWNVRGANNTEFKRNYKFMVQIHQPVILGLLETRMQDHKRISKTLGFSNNIQFPATGNFGGRVLMWKDENINITEISISPQVIYTMIQVINPPSQWFFSLVYASTDFEVRKLLWNQLTDLSSNIDLHNTNS